MSDEKIVETGRKFRTAYDRVRIHTDPGSPDVIDYQLFVEDDGSSNLKEVGKHSLYDQIQAYREACDLKYILKRYEATGDESLLNTRKGIYLDSTGLPKDRIEWLRLYKNSVEMFNMLPAAAKEDFNNNPDEFYASIGTEKFAKYFKKEEIKEAIKDVAPEKVGDLVE